MKKFLKPPSDFAGPAPGEAAAVAPAGEVPAAAGDIPATGVVPEVAAPDVVAELAAAPGAAVMPGAGDIPGAGAPAAGEKAGAIAGCTPVALLVGAPTGSAGDDPGGIAGAPGLVAAAGAAGAPGRAIGVLPGAGGGGGCWPNEVSARIADRRLAVSSVFIG